MLWKNQSSPRSPPTDWIVWRGVRGNWIFPHSLPILYHNWLGLSSVYSIFFLWRGGSYCRPPLIPAGLCGLFQPLSLFTYIIPQRVGFVKGLYSIFLFFFSLVHSLFGLYTLIIPHYSQMSRGVVWFDSVYGVWFSIWRGAEALPKSRLAFSHGRNSMPFPSLPHGVSHWVGEVQSRVGGM